MPAQALSPWIGIEPASTSLSALGRSATVAAGIAANSANVPQRAGSATP